MMDIHVKAITSEQYCPARKAFVGKAGLAEYQSRAKQHCKDNAPVGTGHNLRWFPITSYYCTNETTAVRGHRREDTNSRTRQ